MALPVSRITQSFVDHGSGAFPAGESSNVSFWVTTIIAGNYAAEQAKHAALYIALTDISIGDETKRTLVASDVVQGVGPAASPFAQRENKWLLRYHDSINDVKYQAEVPCADLSLLAASSEFMDTTKAEWTALKTAFEAVVVSPNDANPVILDSAQFVGRNL